MSEIFSKILKDKNGKVLNVGSQYKQPEWGVESGAEILPETVATYVEDDGIAMVMTAFDAEIETGKTYTVTYNGVDYECVAVKMDEGVHALGDMSALTGEGNSTGEPFAMLAYGSAMAASVGFYAMCMPLDGATSVTLTIKGDLIHPLPEKYIESGGLYVFDITAGSDGTLTTKASFADVLAAIKQGKAVYASSTSTNYSVTTWDNTHICFEGISGSPNSDKFTKRFYYFSFDGIITSGDYVQSYTT